jgi:hypothetical protein
MPNSTEGEYLVVMATRVGTLKALPVRLAYLPARFAAVRVTLSTHTIGLAGLYVPSRGPQQRRNADKRAFQHAVSTYLPHLTTDLGGGPVVIADDLNVVEPDHQPHYPVFGDWEYRFYTDFAAHGLIDTFRQLHHSSSSTAGSAAAATATASPYLHDPPALPVAALLPLPAPAPQNRLERPRRHDRNPRTRPLSRATDAKL